jgi:plastocyanin
MRIVILMLACSYGIPLFAQEQPVMIDVLISRSGGNNSSRTEPERVSDASNVAIWLTPLDPQGGTVSYSSPSQKSARLVQRNKTFAPHFLVVPVGTTVEFPNQDPFFHNIFSLYDGRRFDLGLYEAGKTRTIRFDRPGVSYLFCNIHAEMSAVVLSVDTRYFATSDQSGKVIIRNVPDGRYQLNVWYERSSPGELSELRRVVTISDSSRNLGLISLVEIPNFTLAHKNKYGLDYVPPPNANYGSP